MMVARWALLGPSTRAITAALSSAISSVLPNTAPTGVDGSHGHDHPTPQAGEDAWSAALWMAAISILFMVYIVLTARSRRLGSGSRTNSSKAAGTTCQKTPKRSLSQPHGRSSPPSVRLAQ